MKLIHLSDLHIGKRVNNFSMLEDQKYVLEQILEIIKEEEPDAVMISGDLYDKKVPSKEAVKMVDDLLYAMSKMDLQVFVLSGNHDAPERIAYASRLIKLSGVHMSPVYDGNVEPVILKDEFGDVNIYMLPFVKPIIVNTLFQDVQAENYTDAVSIAISNMNIDNSKRNVIMAHQFVTGASTCDSEVCVGGIENVDAGVFDDFDYVALGHIHGPQDIVENRIRYCGTPLQYSFSERNHKKSVTVVIMSEKGKVEVSTRQIKLPHRFVQLEGRFDEIVAEYADKQENNYVKVILHDEENVPDAFKRLQNVFVNLMELSYDNKRTREQQRTLRTMETKELSEIELACRLFETVNKAQMSEEQYKYLEGVIEEVKEGLL